MIKREDSTHYKDTIYTMWVMVFLFDSKLKSSWYETKSMWQVRKVTISYTSLIYICTHSLLSRNSIRWFYSWDKSSYIRSVHSQCHVALLKCTEQNVNNQTLTQVSQLYVHHFLCLRVIMSWLNMFTGGHSHVICMCDYESLRLDVQTWIKFVMWLMTIEVLCDWPSTQIWYWEFVFQNECHMLLRKVLTFVIIVVLI